MSNTNNSPGNETFSARMQETGKKAKSAFKRFLLVVLLLAIVGGALAVFISSMTYSQGNRAGFLLKISERGYVFKTYEGQLSVGPLGNFNNAGGTAGNVWNFSAASQAVYSKLQEYEGKYVTLHYRQIYKNFPWQGDTPYMVDEVELVNPQP